MEHSDIPPSVEPDVFQRIENAWNSLPEGARRSLIAGYVLTILASSFGASDSHGRLKYYFEDDDLWAGFFMAFVIYPPLVLTGIWVYRGFKRSS